MNITIPDYVLKAILDDSRNLEKGKTQEKIYSSKKGNRILVYTFWNDDHLVFNMEWEDST